MPQDRKFRVVADWEPAGDQPKAIEELSEALLSGTRRITLLGATGTGKSLDADEPILLYRREGGSWVARCVPIGALVDGHLESALRVERRGDTEISRENPAGYHVLSFNTRTRRAEIKPITAFVRHEAPTTMYRVRLECGRECLLTGDHNLWVLRDGALRLIETHEARPGDAIPLPEALPGPEDDLADVDLLELLRAATVGGEDRGADRSASVSAAGVGAAVGPARLPLTEDVLVLIGCYAAGGSVEEDRVLLRCTWEPARALIQSAFDRLGVACEVDGPGRIRARGRFLAALLATLCGAQDDAKRLPPFWGALSRRQLGGLLRGCLAGGGEALAAGVRWQVASRQLASELAYALARLGLWARISAPSQSAAGRPGSGGYEIRLAGGGALSESARAGEFLAAGLGAPDSQTAVAQPARPRAAVAERDVEAGGAVRWARVAGVEAVPYGRPYVYDVSVAENETFFGGFGGLFLHNTYTMAKVIERVQKPTLVIAHNKTLAAQLCSEFRAFFPENAVHYFISYYDYYQPEAYIPQTDTYIEKDSSINDEIDRLRHAATSALFERRDVLIVASVSCIYGLGSPEDYQGMTLSLKHGDFNDRDKVLRRLVGIQYERNDVGFTRGTFRVRGDVIEIIPVYEENVIRIEFFGDEVDRILELDPVTGEILAEKESITIYPATHYITSEEKMKRAIASIQAELEERLAYFRRQGKLLEAQRLEQRTLYDLEMLQEVGVCQGIENYSRHLTGRQPGEPPATLLDYFPNDFLMIIDESHQTIPQLHAMYNGDRSRKETLVEYGFRLPSALDNRPLKFEEFERHINQVVFVSATPGEYERRVSERIVEQIIRPTGLVDPEVVVRPTKGQIDDLLHEVQAVAARGERALVTTLTKKMAEELTDYLSDMGVRVRYLHSEIEALERVEILRDLRLGVFDVLVGINLLREGLDLPEVSLVAILDADKEGFLRSETSLIQTIGRAARNVNGRVIMYADTITGSMQRAIDETNRRREIQMRYNQEHGITPETVRKRVHEAIRAEPTESEARSPKEEALVRVKGMSAEELAAHIQELEKEMFAAAKRLEFERAAELRDEIQALREGLLEFTG